MNSSRSIKHPLTPPTPQSIVLIGLPGSGKTSLGQTLAQRLGWDFIDSDQAIERQTGQTIPQLFTLGEASFRLIETAVLHSLSQKKSLVIATGGGSVLSPSAMSALKEKNLVIWIDRPLSAIKSDLDSSQRPLLQANINRLDQLAHERRPLYEAYADYHFLNAHSYKQALENLSKFCLSLLAINPPFLFASSPVSSIEMTSQDHPLEDLKALRFSNNLKERMNSMHLLILNGPNLNLLGQREPSIYGHTSLSSLEESLTQLAQKEGITLSFFQSNSEGDLITAIQEAAFKGIDGIVFNAGAYTHYSYAILDAIKAVPTPVIEVHLSNIHQRESFRQQSVLAPACLGQIAGFGADSYRLGILAMIRHLQLVQPSV